MSADRNLLFGTLALQLDFISSDQLQAGMQAWTRDKRQSLAQVLEATGVLDVDSRQVLEPLVARHIQKHAGDPQRSLAAVPASNALLHELQTIADPELQASVSSLGRGRADDTDEMFGAATLGQTPSPGPAAPDQAANEGLRYRILRKYREGGLGIVSIAQDTELDREVALKEMKAQYAYDPIGRVRFVREAEVTGGLEHPNIVPVYGLGAHGDGRPYYAMRLIRGDNSLADEIKSFHEASKNPYAADQNLRLRGLLQRFIAVCDALEYAHSRGVIHRDLKPANIMLGKFGETLVVDWGLAKLLANNPAAEQAAEGAQEPLLKSSPSDSTYETIMGAAVGTPQFMAPEQADGRLDLLSPATDVYGLGATLYALLTGQSPIDGATTAEVLIRVRNGETVPARARLRTIPAPLAAICTKALSLQPADRYASARDLAADISAYLADEPVAAYREPIMVRARRWARKHPAIVSGGLASALVTIVGLLIGFVVLGQKNRELAEKEAIATAVKDFLVEDLLQLAAPQQQADSGVQVDPDLKLHALLVRGSNILATRRLLAGPRAQAEVRKLIDRGLRSVDPALTVREVVLRAVPRIEGRFQNNPLMEAELRYALGFSLMSTGDYPESIQQFRRTIDLYSSQLGPAHPDTLQSMHNLSATYLVAGRLDEALPLTEQAFQLSSQALGPEHPDTLRQMHNLTMGYLSAGRLQDALPLAERNLQLRRAKLGPENPDTVRSMHHLASAYEAAGRVQESLQLQAEAFKIRQKTLGPEHPDTLQSMSFLAIALHAAGRPDAALPLFEKSLQVMKVKLGPEHPETLRAMHNLAAAYALNDRDEEALPLFEESYRFRLERLGPEHPDTLDVMHNLASVYESLGRLREALPLFEQTLELRKAKLGPEHPDTQTSLDSLASAYRAAGRLKDAVPLFEENLRLRKATLGPGHADTLDSAISLANACEVSGRPDKALPLIEDTYQIKRTQLGPGHPDTLDLLNDLAITHHYVGHLERALQLFEETLELKKQHLGPEHPSTLGTLNYLAMQLATVADEKLRDPRRAVELAEAAVAVQPMSAEFRGTLGIARYRTGAWQAALTDLEAAHELREPHDRAKVKEAFFIALAHWKLDSPDEARTWLAKAVKWMEEANPNEPVLKRFRAEAEGLIGEATKE